MYSPLLVQVMVIFVRCGQVSSHELDDHPSWKYLPRNDCGYGALSYRIVGGKEASLGQFPWMARIGYKIKPDSPKLIYLCAGSLINTWYVITAVHCAVGALGDNIYSVRLGENYIKQKEDCEDYVCAPPVQDIEVAAVLRYDEYAGTLSISYGDIGLIKLSTQAQSNDFVQPICLPRGSMIDRIQEHLASGTYVEVAGWGATNSFSGNIPDKLMYVRIPVVDIKVCERIFKPNWIDHSQICVGAGRGKDSCVGDSGGPLMNPVAFNSPPRYFLFGIVSYGMKWCGISAAVYTNVTYYMEWILDQIDK